LTTLGKLTCLTHSEREAFENSLLEAMDETLSLVLSERTKEAIYAHMERYYALRREEIPQKPDRFMACLDRIFGRARSVIEKMVLKKFYSKLGMDLIERKNWNFHDYIIFAERSAGELSNRSQAK